MTSDVQICVAVVITVVWVVELLRRYFDRSDADELRDKLRKAEDQCLILEGKIRELEHAFEVQTTEYERMGNIKQAELCIAHARIEELIIALAGK